MPKKSATSSTGTTVNPVPPPAAPPAPPAPATAPARKPSTAGPLPVAAASDAPDYESAFTTDLTSLIGSDEPTTPPAPALREPQAKTRTADKTPVEDEADAEGSDKNTDEEAADAEAPTGEPTLEDDSPEPEATADEAHAEDEAEDADEEGDDKRNWPGSYKRRIKKLTAKAEKVDELQRKVEELEARLESTKPAPPMVNGVPVSEEETELRGEVSNVDDWLNWFEQNPAGGTRKLQDGSTVAYDAIGAEQARQQLQQMRVQKAAELGVIQRLNRKRAEQERRQAEQEVAQVLSQRYPWTKDKTNPSAQAIENALRQYPALRSVPHAKVWMASHLALEALLKQQQKPVANGNGHTNGHAAPAPRPAPRAPGRPAAAPAALNGRQTAVRVSEKAFFENTDSPQADSFLTSLVEGR